MSRREVAIRERSVNSWMIYRGIDSIARNDPDTPLNAPVPCAIVDPTEYASLRGRYAALLPRLSFGAAFTDTGAPPRIRAASFQSAGRQ